MSPHHSDQMSQRAQGSVAGSLCMSKSKTSLSVGLSVVSDRGRYRAVSDSVWTAKKREKEQ